MAAAQREGITEFVFRAPPSGLSHDGGRLLGRFAAKPIQHLNTHGRRTGLRFVQEEPGDGRRLDPRNGGPRGLNEA